MIRGMIAIPSSLPKPQQLLLLFGHHLALDRFSIPGHKVVVACVCKTAAADQVVKTAIRQYLWAIPNMETERQWMVVDWTPASDQPRRSQELINYLRRRRTFEKTQPLGSGCGVGKLNILWKTPSACCTLHWNTCPVRFQLERIDKWHGNKKRWLFLNHQQRSSSKQLSSQASSTFYDFNI